jgi:hypothetical protein
MHHSMPVTHLLTHLHISLLQKASTEEIVKRLSCLLAPTALHQVKYQQGASAAHTSRNSQHASPPAQQVGASALQFVLLDCHL